MTPRVRDLLMTLLALLPSAAGCGGEIPDPMRTEGEAREEGARDPYLDQDARIDSGSCADEHEVSALNALNAARRTSGLAPVHCLGVLHEVASGHASYLRLNPDDGDRDVHRQRAGKAGFTGVTLDERARAAGVNRSDFWISEGVGGGDGPVQTVRRHLHSVYHRSHLLSPGTRYFAISDRVLDTLTYVDVKGLGMGVYPGSGQREVPVDFASHLEVPSPMPGARLVGFPVSVHLPREIDLRTGREPTVRVRRFEVQADGRDVRGRILTHAGDEEVFSSDAFFVPFEPLSPGTKYTVRFDGSYGEGEFERTWSFFTSETGLSRDILESDPW